MQFDRGVGTGEAGEAAASPEIRGWQTNFLGEKGKKLAIFEVASPEIILFLRPWKYFNVIHHLLSNIITTTIIIRFTDQNGNLGINVSTTNKQ